MSESSESLCKLISNIPRINWAIRRRYMLSPWFYLLVPGSCACMCALVRKTCNYSVLASFFCKEKQQQLIFFASGLLRKRAVNVKHGQKKQKNKKQTNECKVNSNGNTALCNLFIMKKKYVFGKAKRGLKKKNYKKQKHLRCVQMESWNTVIGAQKLFATLLTEAPGARRKKKERKYQ